MRNNDADYKSLYGEKNPCQENTKNKEKFLNLLQGYNVKYHLKRTGNAFTQGGKNLCARAKTKDLRKQSTVMDKEEFQRIIKRGKSQPHKSVKSENPVKKPGKYI